MNISMSKLFYGDFNSLICELTRLILAQFVRRGTAEAHAPSGPGLAPTLASSCLRPQSRYKYTLYTTQHVHTLYSVQIA